MEYVLKIEGTIELQQLLVNTNSISGFAPLLLFVSGLVEIMGRSNA